MTEETEITREAALNSLEKSGYEWKRIGKGQRYVVELTKSSKKMAALVKVASRGTAMVKTDGDNADEAKLSGFSSDVDHVLFAVGNPKASASLIRTFLVPIQDAETAYRDAHRGFRLRTPEGKPNLTWVISFPETNDASSSGYYEKWEKYEVKSDFSVNMPLDDKSMPKLTIAEAKARLAESLGISVDSIRIVIEG